MKKKRITGADIARTMNTRRWQRPGARKRASAAAKQAWARRNAKLALLDDLWDAVNERRVALIAQKHDGGLTEYERGELAQLQALADRYLRAVAPFDLDELRRQLEGASRTGIKENTDAENI